MKKASKFLMAVVFAGVTFTAGRFLLAMFQETSSISHFISTCVVSLFILVLLYSAGLLMFAKDGE